MNWTHDSMMTWPQFKEFVDKKLEELGVPAEATIEYIDTSWPSADGLTVSYTGGQITIG